MNILIASQIFPPHVGGSGVVAKILAEEFTAQGHCVSVLLPKRDMRLSIDFSEVSTPSKRDYQIEFSSTLLQDSSIVKNSDVILLNGAITLVSILSLAFALPFVVRHPMFPSGGFKGIRDRVLTSRAFHIAPSEAVRAAFKGKSRWFVSSNPYDDLVFHNRGNCEREYVAFVGRLIEEKGAEDCIRAFATSRITTRAKLFIIGDGEARSSLEDLCVKLNITERVEFLGALQPHAIAGLLRKCKVQVVPSKWQEPFGIVALEGLACGCNVVVSQSGGLLEAIGPLGRSYPIGNIAALRAAIEEEYDAAAPDDKVLSAWLAKNTRSAVGKQYLSILEKAYAKG